MVFRISRPARMAWVRDGEMSRAAIGIPVLWTDDFGDKGLDQTDQ